MKPNSSAPSQPFPMAEIYAKPWRRVGVAVAAVVIAALTMHATPMAQSGTNVGAGKITGRVVLPDGSPVEGLRIAVLTADAKPSTSASIDSALMSIGQTDRDGRYRLEDIPPGRYYLVAGPLEALTYFPDVLTKADATLLSVTAGGTLADHDFHLKAPYSVRVSGRVIREGHQEGNRVVLRGVRPPNAIAQIAADGSFEFPSVPPGTYQVTVLPHLGALKPLSLVVVDKDVAAWEIPIPRSAVSDITFRFRLSVDGGGPVPRFSLQFKPVGPHPANMPENGRNLPAVPDDPRTTPSLPIGEYQVTPAQPISAGYSIKSMVSGSTDLLRETLKVTPDRIPPITVMLAVASPPPWVRVSGRVTGMDQASDRVYQITINSLSVLVYPLTAAVRLDGSFEFPAVLPGTYDVTLQPALDPFRRSLTVKTSDLSGVEIPVAIPVLRVSGRVTGAPSTTGTRQRVEVALRTPKEWPGGAVAMRSVVAADGSFSIGPVQPGGYMLDVLMCTSDACSEMAPGIAVTLTDRNITDLVAPFDNRRR